MAHAATRNGRGEASWRGTCVPVIDWTKKLGTVVPNLLTHGLVQTPGWAARVQTSSATGPPPHHPGAPQLGATGGSLTGRETHLLPAVPR